jgi:hypothetical protein
MPGLRTTVWCSKSQIFHIWMPWKAPRLHMPIINNTPLHVVTIKGTLHNKAVQPSAWMQTHIMAIRWHSCYGEMNNTALRNQESMTYVWTTVVSPAALGTVHRCNTEPPRN